MKSVYQEARSQLGTYEWAEGSNPKVDAYFDEVGHGWATDETAWCAAFVGSMLARAGYPHTGELTARSYLDWGKVVKPENAKKGDVVVLWRGSPDSWQGHVAFFEGYDGDNVLLLGGNQRDQVNIAPYSRDRILGVRRMTKHNTVQSKTVQATMVQGATAATGGMAAISQLDGTAQIVALGVIAVIVVTAAIVLRERLIKWQEGDR